MTKLLIDIDDREIDSIGFKSSKDEECSIQMKDSGDVRIRSREFSGGEQFSAKDVPKLIKALEKAKSLGWFDEAVAQRDDSPSSQEVPSDFEPEKPELILDEDLPL